MLKRFLRSLRPPQCQFHTAARLFLRRLTRCAFIKGHSDLGAERRLHLHRDLRRKKAKRAVDVRAKLGSCFRDFAESAQTPNLEAARVSQHCALPADEFVQTAARLDRFYSRAQPEVIGIPQNDSRIE